MTELLLFTLALFTSTVAGVLGLGGGMLLIAVLPLFLPAAALVPVHGLTQLASNASRVWFSLDAVVWRLVPRFIVGSIAGLLVFGLFLFNLPVDYIPFFIGSYILLNLWSRPFKQVMRRYESFYMAGFMQTGLSLLVGATGPLTLTLVKNELADKHQIVATTALFMAISHLGKLAVFGMIGFAFWDYWPEQLMLIAGAVLGSLLGTRLRDNLNGRKFIVLLNIALTLLAVRMIILVVI